MVQYFETASRSSSSVTSLGLVSVSMSDGNAPFANTRTKYDAPGAAARCTERR